MKVLVRSRRHVVLGRVGHGLEADLGELPLELVLEVSGQPNHRVIFIIDPAKINSSRQQKNGGKKLVGLFDLPVGLGDNPSDIIGHLQWVEIECGAEPHLDPFQVDGHSAARATAALDERLRVRLVPADEAVHDGLHGRQLLGNVLGS